MLGLTLHPWWLQQEAGRPLDISSLHFSFDQTTPTWQGAALNGSTQKGIALPVALHPAPSYVRWPRSIMLAKRIEDIVLGSLLLVLFTPIFGLIALAIRLDTPGSAFFVQERRGLRLRTFRCYKFRTMQQEASDYDSHEQTQEKDPRVTRVGAFLRRHSLDELPQLINVVRGNMSLCGPRPHALGTKIGDRLLEEVNGQYLSRYCVKPGITGWAQIHGYRGILDTPEKLEKRVEYDLYYTTNWSIKLDLYILWRTAWCLFDDENAY
jgi:lipopolysaccharide/colanic/teichoic acid biosynthesis glycosyltransferase